MKVDSHTLRRTELLLSAFCVWFGTERLAFAQAWAQSSSIPIWAVASSADGSKLAAVFSFGGPIYTSTNSGVTWNLSSAPSSYQWISVASSADGSKLVAVAAASNGPIFSSTNSGATWISNNAPVGYWASVASSADGTRLVAAIDSGPIYTSTNSGLTWRSTSATNLAWESVASSADGTALVAMDQGANVYTSGNGGGSWALAATFPFPVNDQTCVTSSADGTRLFAAVYGKGIYASTNSGASWIRTSASSIGWTGVACSSDGMQLVGVTGGYLGPGPIYTSTNGGQTWLSNSVPNQDWAAAASSADGGKLVAVSDGGIYTSVSLRSAVLSIAPSSDNITLSWTVPSADFRLKQCATLSSTNWQDVTNSPSLNLTNLKQEVTLFLLTNSAFYRLGLQ